jgi:hypothetical protein
MTPAERRDELERLRVALRTARWADGSMERVSAAIDELTELVRADNALAMYDVYYAGADGKNGREYWDTIAAQSVDDACARARAIEPECCEGLPMIYAAVEAR